MTDQRQYLRQCKLILTNPSGQGIDLSKMRIVFNVKKSSSQTTNAALIRIYNLSDNTKNLIRQEFQTVVLEAGYQSNSGVIFAGNIKQYLFGRENSTDTYVEIAAADGDYAYNFSTISTTLSGGSSQEDQLNAIIKALELYGVTPGYIEQLDYVSLPRAKPMYGMTRDYLRQLTESTDSTWSIQDGKLQILKKTSLLPGETVVLNSKTGLIGTPEQTNEGIAISALLNPLIKVGGTVQVNQKDVQEAKLEDTNAAYVANNAPSISPDGFYRVLVAEYIGDTFGNDWDVNTICLSADISAPANERVSNT